MASFAGCAGISYSGVRHSAGIRLEAESSSGIDEPPSDGADPLASIDSFWNAMARRARHYYKQTSIFSTASPKCRRLSKHKLQHWSVSDVT
jgi:hypothetical protein